MISDQPVNICMYMYTCHNISLSLFLVQQVTKESLGMTGLASCRALDTALAPVQSLLERFSHNMSLLVHPQTKWAGIRQRIRRMMAEKVSSQEVGM